MKFTIAAAALALAGSAVALPYNEYVVVTKYNTVYAGAVKPAASTPCPEGDKPTPAAYHPKQNHPVQVYNKPKPAYNAGSAPIIYKYVYPDGSPAPAPGSNYGYNKPRPHHYKPKPKPKPQPYTPPKGYQYPAPAPKPAPKPYTPPKASTGGHSSTGNDMIDTIVNKHNQYRAMHNAPALKWDNTLANFAANNMPSCDMQHTKDGPYGENLAMGASPGEAVDMWYSEKNKYSGNWDYSSGHFSQVVWKATHSIGCHFIESCKYLKCEYNVPGNLIGSFAQNVQA